MPKRGVNLTKPGRPRALATAVIVCGLLLTGFSLILASDRSYDVFRLGAVGVGVSLCIATYIEALAGVRSLFRVDILMLWVLYGLTFLEFLFPQPAVDALISSSAAVNGTTAVLVGFAGIALGRHFISDRNRSRQPPTFIILRPGNVFLLFILATCLGYLHIFLAVNFDPFEAIRQMSLPRFTQSWSRGQYGDAYSLLYELGALISLLPAIAGLIYARFNEYGTFEKLTVTIVLIFTVYYGFASGTRSVIAGYVITFGGIYLLAKPNLNWKRVLTFGIPMVVLMVVGTSYMLKFRTVGLSNFDLEQQRDDSFFVDYNIVNISRLTEVFPDSFEFLGLEVPYNILVRPIPRIFWPGKPEGLTVSIETAVGADAGVTVSCTFIGEAYIAGGLIGVLLFSLAFGAAAEKWNRLGRNNNSQFAQLLYVSGFLCAALAMRSVLSIVPIMLPTLALWLYGRLWLGQLSRPASAVVDTTTRR